MSEIPKATTALRISVRVAVPKPGILKAMYVDCDRLPWMRDDSQILEEINARLDDITSRRVGVVELRASSDYNFIRFVVGRHWALQNAHEFVGRAAGIKSSDQLEEFLSDTQPLLPGSVGLKKRLGPAPERRKLSRTTSKRRK